MKEGDRVTVDGRAGKVAYVLANGFLGIRFSDDDYPRWVECRPERVRAGKAGAAQ